ncbi:MAG: metallophosphoesterase [Candidatus Zixiibacteriota bacterium]
MRLAAISDLHCGDPMGSLVGFDPAGNPVLGSMYSDLIKAVGGKLDYLVLLGDVLDCSIVGYEKAFAAAKVLFTKMQEDGLTTTFIYVPGNHDFDIWTAVEYEVNIIHQIGAGKVPRKFKMAVPGVVDDRPDAATRGAMLPGVTIRSGPDPYGGLFLDHISEPDQNPGNFIFVYPNLYLVTDEGESVLLTHGHYLEYFWTLLGEWTIGILQEGLKIDDVPTIKQLVSINFPLCQASCSGIGQAGPLTDTIRKIQRDVKDHNLGNVKKYMDRIDNKIDDLFDYSAFNPKEWLTDAISNNLKKDLMESLGKYNDTRYDDEFIYNPEVRDRFWRYYASCKRELESIERDSKLNIPAPLKLIFGHTHVPISWDTVDPPHASHEQLTDNKRLDLFNTGGWLWRRNDAGQKVFGGAEVFLYETGKGITSVAVQ